MITAYIRAAMHAAKYELLPDDEGYYGWIPPLEGVWANSETLEACREELQDVLEAWVLLGLQQGHVLPVLHSGEGMVDLNIARVA